MIETDAELQPFEVDDLDGWVLLDLISDNASQRMRADRRNLRLAHQLCITHPVVDGEAATWGDGIPGLADYTDTLGGEGTPTVAAFTIEKWSTAAGVSHHSAKRTLSAALDLHHRLVKLWARVDALEVPAWKACRVAEETNRLSAEATTWVDDELERRGTYGLPTIDLVIRSAIAKFHPELIKETGSRPGRDCWDVTVDHTVGDGNGTSRIEATGDSVDLEKFHSMISDEAATLGRLGDADTLGQRKAKALGILADRRASGDLLGLLDGDGAELTHSETGKPVTPRRSYLKARLFVHITLADLAVMSDQDFTGNGTSDLVADTSLFGPAHLDTLKIWLAQLGTAARITPVIDVCHRWSVDQHDPPETMREEVIVRDRTCVFPGCGVDSRRCDLDHIEAYDENGPPGQTSPENLAPLCRRHHLVKTHGPWRYARNRDGTYTWTNQHQQSWLVTPFGSVDSARRDPSRGVNRSVTCQTGIFSRHGTEV